MTPTRKYTSGLIILCLALCASGCGKLTRPSSNDPPIILAQPEPFEVTRVARVPASLTTVRPVVPLPPAKANGDLLLRHLTCETELLQAHIQLWSIATMPEPAPREQPD